MQQHPYATEIATCDNLVNYLERLRPKTDEGEVKEEVCGLSFVLLCFLLTYQFHSHLVPIIKSLMASKVWYCSKLKSHSLLAVAARLRAARTARLRQRSPLIWYEQVIILVV